MRRADSESICYDFLYKESMGCFGKRLTTRAAECHLEILIGEHTMGGRENFVHFLRLHRIVAFVCKVKKFFGRRIYNGDFHSGGADVNADP